MNSEFVVSSVTFALRAKRMLEKRGIAVGVEKNSSKGEAHSCTYTLKVSPSLEAKALEILKEGNINLLN